MIPINLLPHRAARRKAQQQQFFVLVGLTLGLAGAIIVAVHIFFAGRIENQVERNKYLESEIVLLDKQIDEIRKLKEQTQALLARKRVVESLQTNRTETVRLLDQLVRQLPDGIYLKSVKQTGQRVNVIGYATSNARVSTLMRNFEASRDKSGHCRRCCLERIQSERQYFAAERRNRPGAKTGGARRRASCAQNLTTHDA